MFGSLLQLPIDPRKSDLRSIVRAIRDGLIVALPSDEGYLIVGNADNEGTSRTILARSHELPALTLPNTATFERVYPDAHPILKHVQSSLLDAPITVRLPHPEFEQGLPLKVARGVLCRTVLSHAGVPVFSYVAVDKRGQALAKGEHVAASVRHRPDLAVQHAHEVAPLANARLTLQQAGLVVNDLGSLARSEVERRARLKVHFVCLGNLNRSAFCAARIRALQQSESDLAEREGFDYLPIYDASSSGMIALPGAHSPDEMVIAGRWFQCDDYLEEHRAKRFDVSDVTTNTAVFPATRKIAQDIRRIVFDEDERERIVLFEEEEDLPDPMGGAPEDYVTCAKTANDWLERHFLSVEPLPIRETRILS